MKLRHQLILVSLLSLMLPWLGSEFMIELENALRQRHQDSLLTSTRAIALYLENQSSNFPQRALTSAIDQAERSSGRSNANKNPIPDTFHASRCRTDIKTDGYDDDWFELGYHSFNFHHHLDPSISDRHTKLQLCHNNKHLFILISVKDNQVIMQGTPQSHEPHDMVRLLMVNDRQQAIQYELKAAAPGLFHPLTRNKKSESRVQAAWQSTDSGFNVEIKAPIELSKGGLGFITFDADHDGEAKYGSLIVNNHCCNPIIKPPQRLVFTNAKIDKLIRSFSTQGTRLLLVDRNGDIHSDTDSREPYNSTTALENSPLKNQKLVDTKERSITHPYLIKLYQWLLAETPTNQASPILKFETQYNISGSLLTDLMSGNPVNNWVPHITLTPSTQTNNDSIDQAHIIAAYPIFYNEAVAGGIIAIESRRVILSLTNSATLRVLTLSIASAATIFLMLILFASLLSFRIRKLTTQVDQALDSTTHIASSKIMEPIKTRSSDEIGELADRFNNLFSRINQQKQTISTLIGALANELKSLLDRTDKSLNELDMLSKDNAAEAQIHQAQLSNLQQRKILKTLEILGRIEAHPEREKAPDFDFIHLIEKYLTRFRENNTGQVIEFSTDKERPLPMMGTAELVEQLLDILLESANTLSDAGKPISLSLKQIESEKIASLKITFYCSSQSTKRAYNPINIDFTFHLSELIVTALGGSFTTPNLIDEAGFEIVIDLPISELSNKVEDEVSL